LTRQIDFSNVFDIWMVVEVPGMFHLGVKVSAILPKLSTLLGDRLGDSIPRSWLGFEVACCAADEMAMFDFGRT